MSTITEEKKQELAKRSALARATREAWAERVKKTNQTIKEQHINVAYMRRCCRLVSGNINCVFDPKGGMTIVWRKRPQDSFLELATEICSKSDDFVKDVGRVAAVDNLINGKFIRLPVPPNTTASDVVNSFFILDSFIDQ